MHRTMAVVENPLIDLLPGKDRRRLLGLCESVDLVMADVLSEPGKNTRHVYFPTDCFVSLVSLLDTGSGVEVGMVAREGMLGTQLALHVETAPMHAIVQGPGAARRITAATFRGELAQSPALQKILSRYIYVQITQMATSAACLRFHLVGPRLARWLLMSQDRAHSDSFRLTHEFLAYMLGVRRVGITAAAGALQGNGLIEYHRGNLTVLNRRGLEAAACRCYAVDRKVYTKLLQ
jgi:CRP-like cAMP-binding protein